jgi:hypothetical protein
MKRSLVNMGSMFLMVGFCWISDICNSQDIKISKQERKEARKAEIGYDYLELGTLLENRKFVLRLEQDLSRSNIEINPQLNYLIVDSLNFTYETEHKYYVLLRLVEENPLKGKIDNWKLVKDDKHLSYHLQFKMITRIGLFDVYMVIRPDKISTGYIALKENSYSFFGRIGVL